MLEKRNKISRYKTGSEKFDAFLNGGFESQSITRAAGEFGSGKSQICHALCIAANNFIIKDESPDSETSNMLKNYFRNLQILIRIEATRKYLPRHILNRSVLGKPLR